MESAVSFAPLRPADFVNFAGRGGAGQGLLFAGRGGAGQPVFPRGGAGRPSLVEIGESGRYILVHLQPSGRDSCYRR